MMNSQVCSFGKLHANPPPIIRLSVGKGLAGATLTPFGATVKGGILIKALVQIICHKINDWIYRNSKIKQDFQPYVRQMVKFLPVYPPVHRSDPAVT